MADKKITPASAIGIAIGVGLTGLAVALPPPYGKMLDNLIGLIVLLLFLAVGGWVLFWVVRLRRWRRRTQAKPPLQSN
jgi:tellurite resistance protein TehA-like permease